MNLLVTWNALAAKRTRRSVLFRERKSVRTMDFHCPSTKRNRQAGTQQKTKNGRGAKEEFSNKVQRR